MSDMRKLLESMDKFAGEEAGQKPGDQVRGTDNPKKSGKKHGFAGRLVGEDMDEFTQQLMLEYNMFVDQSSTQGNTQADNPTSPVANINPPGQGTAATQANSQAQTQQVAQGQVAGAVQNQPPATAGQAQQAQQGQKQNVQSTAQQAATNLKTQQDLTTNLSNLKSLNPNMNVQKTVQALQKDPTKLSPTDAQALGQVAQTIGPALKDRAALGQLKSNVQKLIK